MYINQVVGNCIAMVAPPVPALDFEKPIASNAEKATWAAYLDRLWAHEVGGSHYSYATWTS